MPTSKNPTGNWVFHGGGDPNICNSCGRPYNAWPGDNCQFKFFHLPFEKARKHAPQSEEPVSRKFESRGIEKERERIQEILDNTQPKCAFCGKRENESTKLWNCNGCGHVYCVKHIDLKEHRCESLPHIPKRAPTPYPAESSSPLVSTSKGTRSQSVPGPGPAPNKSSPTETDLSIPADNNSASTREGQLIPPPGVKQPDKPLCQEPGCQNPWSMNCFEHHKKFCQSHFEMHIERDTHFYPSLIVDSDQPRQPAAPIVETQAQSQQSRLASGNLNMGRSADPLYGWDRAAVEQARAGFNIVMRTRKGGLLGKKTIYEHSLQVKLPRGAYDEDLFTKYFISCLEGKFPYKFKPYKNYIIWESEREFKELEISEVLNSTIHTFKMRTGGQAPS